MSVYKAHLTKDDVIHMYAELREDMRNNNVKNIKAMKGVRIHLFNMLNAFKYIDRNYDVPDVLINSPYQAVSDYAIIASMKRKNVYKLVIPKREKDQT